MTFMNATYRRIKTFRWKEKVWLIIEDGGIYEMVADEKGYLKQTTCKYSNRLGVGTILDETDMAHIRRHMNSNQMISDYELTGRRKRISQTTCVHNMCKFTIDGALALGDCMWMAWVQLRWNTCIQALL